MGYLGGVQPDAVFSASDLLQQGKGFGLLDSAEDHSGRAYRYALSTDTIAQYDCAIVDSSGYARAITSTLAQGGGIIGIAQGTMSSGYYGWVQVRGATTVNCLSTCSSNVALYTSGTAGKLDDASASQVKLAGVEILANITAAGPANGVLSVAPFAAI